MTIATPASGILNFKIIPVDCSCCEYYGDLSNSSDDTKMVLLKATTTNRLNEERKMLMRIRELFNCHPNSKHKKIINFTSEMIRQNILPEVDENLEKDLNDNPDISEYMRDNVFDLASREDFTKDSNDKLQALKDRKDIACPKCKSVLVLPNFFYSMIGSYEDNIAHERSRRTSRLINSN